MAENRHLLIVYHSRSDSTRRMADAVCEGASSAEFSGIEVRMLDAASAGADDLLWADALILGTPENFGYMSGLLKDFLERVYYPCLEQVAGKPWALFVRAGNDGSGAIESVTRIVTGLRLRQVCEPLLIAGDFDPARLEDCRELGALLAAGLESGMF